MLLVEAEGPGFQQRAQGVPAVIQLFLRLQGPATANEYNTLET